MLIIALLILSALCAVILVAATAGNHRDDEE